MQEMLLKSSPWHKVNKVSTLKEGNKMVVRNRLTARNQRTCNQIDKQPSTVNTIRTQQHLPTPFLRYLQFAQQKK
jgi:hypothetical protein